LRLEGDKTCKEDKRNAGKVSGLKPPEGERKRGRPRCRWRKMFNEMIKVRLCAGFLWFRIETSEKPLYRGL
jgi:hypothetical protein